MRRIVENIRFGLFLVVLICVLAAALFWALSIGTVHLSLSQIYGAIVQQLESGRTIEAPGQGPVHDIVWLLRLPRLVLAALMGAGLSVCGVVMQAIVKNPLADPYILGISSGASLGATAAILLGVGAFLGPNFVGIAAFIGAMAISLAVLFISNLGGRSSSVKLLLAGMALSAVCSAFSSFIVYFANDKDGIQTITYWLMGSFTSASYQKILIGCPLIVAGIIIIYLLRWRLNILSLSDDEARASGINIKQTRMLFIVASTLVTASAVSMCGQVGWIGLLIPHASRMLVGSNNRYVVPLSLSLGASFMILIDTLSRSISIIELPLSILTAIIGAPAFISLLNKTRSNLQ